MDQAQNLRNIVKQAQVVEKTARLITVTSGKGGVGKTNFTANLAVWLGNQGKRVVIIDADFGLANIEVLFNVWPKYSFADVLRGTKKMTEILTDAPCGIKFISGGTGFRDLANITDQDMDHVLNCFEYLDKIADIILIDTGAGISKTVTTFVKASNEAVVITTPEPTSISDSYTLIKNVYDAQGGPDIGVVLNKVDNDREGVVVFDRLKGVCERFLKITPRHIGSIVYDQELVRAVKDQKPIMMTRPGALYSRSIEQMGRRILNREKETAIAPERTGIRAFMKRILSR